MGGERARNRKGRGEDRGVRVAAGCGNENGLDHRNSFACSDGGSPLPNVPAPGGITTLPIACAATFRDSDQCQPKANRRRPMSEITANPLLLQDCLNRLRSGGPVQRG